MNKLQLSMKSKYLVPFFFLISIKAYSQEIPIDSTRQVNPEISLDFGFQFPKRNNFEEIYGSSLMPSVGFGIAIPPTKRFRIKGDLNYSWKNSNEAKLRLFLLNITGKYYVLLTEKFSISVEGGITLMKEKEEYFRSDGSKIGSSNAKGLVGYYLGSELERRFGKYGANAHLGYTISRRDVKNLVTDYGGMNISIGGKYYF